MQAIIQDAQGIFWLGTMKGLLRLDPATRDWTHYASMPDDPRSLSTDVIFCLLNDPKDANILWVGTNGGGLEQTGQAHGTIHAVQYRRRPAEQCDLRSARRRRRPTLDEHQQRHRAVRSAHACGAQLRCERWPARR
ncbi:MAG: hypothetical protein IPG10_18150 [Flavobacteriales bacterium]|nr:hypothetical protein [Flavobacteriales bacterium]